MMMMGSANTRSRSRRSCYGGNGSSSERLLHPAATRHDVVSASTAADHLADLHEEDVWSAVSGGAVTNDHHYGSAPAMHRRPAYAYAGGGLSLAFEAASSPPPPPARHSAPVSVPEWPAATGPEDHHHHHHHHAGGGGGGTDLDDLEWVPPHEYLQQRRRCGGASVLEGAGRTLKGRDITRVRDAVWSKTGFFG